jgi:hypothetical protein
VDGSAVYNCYWSSPVQSFSSPSPSGLMTTFCCLRLETPPTWRASSLYLYPPGIGWPNYTLQSLGSLFFPSYYSQSCGGGIRTRLPGTDLSENDVSTELFPSNGCCTVGCLHSCYLTTGLHVSVLSSFFLVSAAFFQMCPC